MKKNNEMTKILAATVAPLLLALTPAKAEEGSIQILQQPLETRGATVTEAAFKVEPSLSRAWIEFTLQEPSTSDDGGPTTYRFRTKVDGLVFEPETQKIVFSDSRNAPVVCAEMVTKKILWRRVKRVVNTGNCEISAKVSVQAIDTGFELQNREVLSATLKVRTEN